VHLEGAHRVGVVRGDEDDERHLAGAHRADHVEPVAAGHLDVEEDEVRPERPDGVDGLGPGTRLADDAHVGVAREQRAQAAPRRRLVVGDEHGHRRARGAVRGGGSVRSGHARGPASEGEGT
jgi:hypothetical protein